jgi:hypothetical protein
MVVEPFMPQTKFYGPIFACALCGEQRKAEVYVRKHRFRTSEEESAQRYPLCDYCLGRTRAAGDFVGFLRMVRDGHWRAESEEEQKGAWEEAVRLRERMFWARQGGGVIPSLAKQGTPSTANMKSARQSLESIPEQDSPARRASQAVQAAQAESVVKEDAQVTAGGSQPVNTEKAGPDEKLLDVFKSHRQSMSLGGNLVQAPIESPAANVMPEVVEPRETIPVPVSNNQTVEMEAQTLESAVPVPVPQVGSPEPEAIVDATPFTTPATEVAPSISANETHAVQPDIMEPVTTEHPVGTSAMNVVPTAAGQSDSAVIIDTEEPSKDAPVPVEDDGAPQTPLESPPTLRAPNQPAERRGSSVLARVRAMESPKPPGSFD